MGSSIPKQFLPLAGRPVLVRTVERFRAALPEAMIIVVLPETEMERWQVLTQKYHLSNCYTCVGGLSRFHSVRNALNLLREGIPQTATTDREAAGALAQDDLVAIHDGVRPLVSEELILRTIATANQQGTAVPVIEPVDSFRLLTDNQSQPFDRTRLRAVQTPQVFRYGMLASAYERPFDPAFTDDASVVEHAGYPVILCSGERNNLKLTTPSDLMIAEALIRQC